MESITALHHVSFTVSDLDASVRWYQDLLGLQTMMEEEHPGGRAVVLVHPVNGGVVIGLHAHDGTALERGFDETHIGLDHLAFALPDRVALEKWQQRLDEHGVVHSEIKDRDYGSIVTFRDPDGLQLELYAPPAA